MLRRLGSSRRGETPAQLAETPPDPLRATSDPVDFANAERAMEHSLTSIPRMLGLIDAVRYCVARDIPGAFAECGVWKGGSVVAMILTLQALGRDDRDLYLYDTFEGMTAPGDEDTSPFEVPARETWDAAQRTGERAWAGYFRPETFSEEQVRTTLEATGYPAERLHLVRGRVEDTLPASAPERVALLRLDTDWYESTRHELVHLYPRLSEGGVLIVDDYGHWEGARRAVDEYFEQHPLLLARIDYTARMAIKS
jgi:O-methyltransferase